MPGCAALACLAESVSGDDMTTKTKAMFWDFDGTLAYWPRMFSSGLKMVLDEFEHGHQITDEKLVEWLRKGFPWHEPDREYTHLIEPEAWWTNLFGLFEQAYVKNGVLPEKAREYARHARRHFVAAQHYRLFDDTLSTLRWCKENGYTNIIVSNHVPELPEIARALGLMDYVDLCLSSANIGYEKPNPRIFRLASEKAGNPDVLWMVGDNIKADVRGAEAVGIPAILVRRQPQEPVTHYSPDLRGVIDIIAHS